MNMKIVADSDVPFLKGVLEPYGEVVYKKGPEITSEDVRDADALILRTRTRCNAALLDGSKVKLIATATIGTDHVDFDYCNSHGIDVQNAAGCNAGGVMQKRVQQSEKAMKLTACPILHHLYPKGCKSGRVWRVRSEICRLGGFRDR